jgi:hypothetical protein
VGIADENATLQFEVGQCSRQIDEACAAKGLLDRALDESAEFREMHSFFTTPIVGDVGTAHGNCVVPWQTPGECEAAPTSPRFWRHLCEEEHRDFLW